MNSKPLPPAVMQELLTLLDWLDWSVLTLCTARAIWVGSQLAIRWYRHEAIEGLSGAMLAAALLGGAAALAQYLLPES
ncbi:hypothetical protein K7711_36580 [Nocardia sp. CA2R105]|uniref:hypothetical protein n=1 Tax=Nocardia coffeae TaxID=2873381 RepID=UPI001CA6CAB6|nr:hypothetical protein [Nocardia coffeae]MBY8862041.1 hypothetical protein [Nocardia coffeae]